MLAKTQEKKEASLLGTEKKSPNKIIWLLWPFSLPPQLLAKDIGPENRRWRARKGGRNEKRRGGERARDEGESPIVFPPRTHSRGGRPVCVFPGGFSLFLHMSKPLCISSLVRPSVLSFCEHITCMCISFMYPCTTTGRLHEHMLTRVSVCGHALSVCASVHLPVCVCVYDVPVPDL